MKPVANLRHAQFAEIAVEVFDQVRDFVSAHLRQRRGNAFGRELIVPLMLVVPVVAGKHGLQIKIRLQIRFLHQIPNLLLQIRQLRRIEFLDAHSIR